MNGLDPVAGANLVVEAVDKLGPFQTMDGMAGPGAMQMDGMHQAINGQGDPSNIPVVLARSASTPINLAPRSLIGPQAFEQLLTHTGIAAPNCGFIGDDVIDLPILLRAGFAASVPNGHAEVRQRVHYLTNAHGGRGAVRELCDFILQAQGKYEAALAPYLA